MLLNRKASLEREARTNQNFVLFYFFLLYNHMAIKLITPKLDIKIPAFDTIQRLIHHSRGDDSEMP